jgi:dihydrodipicolinate synthase/N-acetylneuraminate lyase
MDWNAVRQSLRGPGALISSIFSDDFELKPQAIEANVRSMVSRGFGSTGGFLLAPCGDGEYVTLTPEENGAVVAAAKSGADGKLPVVAGVHSADFRLAARTAEAARKAGAVAVMFAPPSYYTLNKEAIVDWYERFAKSVDIGIMLYEQAWRGPMVNAGIGPDLVGRLLEIPSVVSMKHVGLFTLIDEFTILDRYHDRMAYIDSSGGYATTAAHMHGAAGWVTEIAPFWPEFEMKYWDLLEAGDYKAAQLWRHRISPLFQFLQDHPSTTTAYSWVSLLKTALEYVGLEGGLVRPPFRALNKSEKREVFDLLASLGVPTEANRH